MAGKEKSSWDGPEGKDADPPLLGLGRGDFRTPASATTDRPKWIPRGMDVPAAGSRTRFQK
jgi:hypothetical protein